MADFKDFDIIERHYGPVVRKLAEKIDSIMRNNMDMNELKALLSDSKDDKKIDGYDIRYGPMSVPAGGKLSGQVTILLFFDRDPSVYLEYSWESAKGPIPPFSIP